MSLLWNSCLRKVRHSNYLSAMLHASRLIDDGTLRIYACEHCKGLHVGHLNPGQTRPSFDRGLRKLTEPVLLRKIRRTESLLLRQLKESALSKDGLVDAAQSIRSRCDYLNSLEAELANRPHHS